MTLAEFAAYMQALAVKAGLAVIPATNAMADLDRDEIKKRLTERGHARGTRTPAPPGSVPAMESGDLAGSVANNPRASTPVVAVATVGPHMPPRDAVNEWGLDGIRPVRAKYMRFYYDGLQLRKVVNVPQREYMLSTVMILVGDGQLHDVAAAAFYAALWG